MKRIIYLVLFLNVWLFARADDANWRLHPIFDEEVTDVVETPSYVYFTSCNLSRNNGAVEVYKSLFRYDKKGEELMALSASNLLNSNSVRDITYNPAKGYLAVLYKDYTLDLLFDNGNVVTIPYYEQANLTFPKTVNSMSIDPANDRLYLATDFGYVAINDKKYEIAESRIYGEPLKAFCRLGNEFLALTGEALLKAPTESHRLSLDQYEMVDSVPQGLKLFPINDNEALLLTGGSDPRKAEKIVRSGNDFEFQDIYSGVIYNTVNLPSGVMMASGGTIFLFKSDGTLSAIGRPSGYGDSAVASNNLADIWVGRKRMGLTSLKKSGDQWSVTRDWMRPNSPATFASTSYVNHPTYGFLMLGYGCVPSTLSLPSYSPMQLSGFKQGRWTNYGPAYTNPAKANIMTASNGMVVDPERPEYVYITSYHKGILRLNLNDPQDLIQMGRPDLAEASNPEFVSLGPEQNTVKGYWNISIPSFDNKGNMWMYFANYDDQEDPNPHYYCWTAEDRRATTSAKDIRLPQRVEFNTYFPISNSTQALVLQKTGNGLIVQSGAQYREIMAMFDTNGTPLDTSDDKVYRFPEFIDIDGNAVDVSSVRYLWEDPSTGYVWVCHRTGVFYFVPSQVRQGNYQLYRLKVPRNDGTNLADYLLDGVSVNHMAADGEGRKWFATAGGGVICTTSDGREILEEFTTANSLLPDDIVYGIGYNSESNSLMFSTAQGYAEYSLPVSSMSTTKEDVRAYPNPVRPNFSGYVTITDIPQGSFVKIADAGGNLVKELGVMSGFDILWDLSDSNFNRIKSGVYYILISPSNETSKYSTVGKILVIS